MRIDDSKRHPYYLVYYLGRYTVVCGWLSSGLPPRSAARAGGGMALQANWALGKPSYPRLTIIPTEILLSAGAIHRGFLPIVAIATLRLLHRSAVADDQGSG